MISELSFPVCNKNLNSFLTGVRKVFKGGKYSRKENIRGDTVIEDNLNYAYKVLFITL